MKKFVFVVLMAAMIAAGCGASKDYVDQQVSAAEARMDSKVSDVSKKADTNADEVAKLKSLAAELSEKTDMAINEAKGFENYQIIWSGVINFDFDSYVIDDVAAQTLMEAGEKMEAHPESIIEFVGHTDVTGTKNYNYLLGDKRASSAKRYLTERFGISLYRMFIVSYGEDKPVAMPDEKYANSKNRRVNMTIWGNP
jgi:peptidoglycan-associated lipoprotein